MALNKLKFNSINVTPAANEALKFNSSANGFETGSAGGAMTFIKKLTASSSGTLSFVDGSSDVVLDNTYKEYIFYFNNIHPSTDGAFFSVGFRDGSTDYDASKTTTYFQSRHDEGDSDTQLAHNASYDLANGTGFQYLSQSLANENDACLGGFLHLFNPSSTTFVKHFMARTQQMTDADFSFDIHVAGYCNVTAAIDGVQFSMSSGNIDSGTFKMYGVV